MLASLLVLRLLVLSLLRPVLVLAQLQNGQYYTPALTIIDSPSPSTPIAAGQNLAIALDLSGNGRLPAAGFASESSLQTGYEALGVYLVGDGVNLTISGGDGVLGQEAGSGVKHLTWSVPSCLSSGTYQLAIYETSRINSASYFTISSIPLILSVSGSNSSSPCPNQNTYQSGAQSSSPYPSSPWLSGMAIQTGQMVAGASVSTSSSAVVAETTKSQAQVQVQAQTTASVPVVVQSSSSPAAKSQAGTTSVGQTTGSFTNGLAATSAGSPAASVAAQTLSSSGSMTAPIGTTLLDGIDVPVTSSNGNGTATLGISPGLSTDPSQTANTRLGAHDGSGQDSSSSSMLAQATPSTPSYDGSYTTTLYGVITAMISLSPESSTLLTLVEPTATFVTALPHGKAAEQPWGVPLIAIVSAEPRAVGMAGTSVLLGLGTCITMMVAG